MGIYHPSYCVTICEEDKDKNARYALGNTGENTLLCFGVNPSTADRYSSDPTMNRLITIAYSNGFDSCMMLNPYPLRTPNPNRLPKQGDLFLLQENRSRIEKIFSQHEGQIALAIWGECNLSERLYSSIGS